MSEEWKSRGAVFPDLRAALGGFLEGDGRFFVHGTNDSDQEILAFIEASLDIFAQVTFGELDVVLGSPVGRHEVEEAVINVYDLEFVTLDIRDIHVVGRRADIFKFLPSEDIYGNKVDLGMAMLAGLGGRHVDDLAWAALDNDMSVLAEGRALHRVGQGRT